MMRAWMAGAAVLVLALGVAGCDSDGSTEPDPMEGVAESALTFLRFPDDLATPATMDTSFWAVAGEDRLLVLEYEPEPGEDDGDEFLTFEVKAESLARWPDGTPFAPGDSVEIRVEVDPDGRFLFRFSPSGLEFSADEPARLEIEYLRLDGDLDDDGDVDDDDDDFEERMRLWKQEQPGDPWFPVGTLKFEDSDELEGEITSFTGFAIAV